MIVSTMYDYSFLLTPSSRTLEHILHRIISDKIGLPTTDRNGKPSFTCFYYDKKTNAYSLSNSFSNYLRNDQLDFLNKVYNYCHEIRHIYVHTNENDIDTAIITSPEEARNIILDCLKLLDEYYELF